ncbi:MAG: hypothetical protein ACI92E_002057 [Oceanicoccus sp.]|jgi:hypothetical protein
MTNIVREPLVYFLLLAGVIFALFEQVSDVSFSDSSQLQKIVVTEGQLSKLTLGFKNVWQRSPSAEELDGMIESHIREEVFYREALALGLDRDDGVVRRRLSQKIQFLSEDLASLVEPAVQDLHAYLVSNADEYRLPPRFTFRQVYFSTSKRGSAARKEAIALREKLRTQDTDIDTGELGDVLMIKHQFDNETDREIIRVLGSDFLQSLRDLPIGSWQGPVTSGYGLHLVRIDERIDGRPPELFEVHGTVLRDWKSAQRKNANEEAYSKMRNRFTVIVEGGSRVSSPKQSNVDVR